MITSGLNIFASLFAMILPIACYTLTKQDGEIFYIINIMTLLYVFLLVPCIGLPLTDKSFRDKESLIFFLKVICVVLIILIKPIYNLFIS